MEEGRREVYDETMTPDETESKHMPPSRGAESIVITRESAEAFHFAECALLLLFH